MTTTLRRTALRDWRLLTYISVVCLAALAVGLLAWRTDSHFDPAALLLLCAMGILSFQLRELDVGSRVGFSFLSIILLASAAIVGPLGAWVVGLLSVALDRRRPRWSTTVFNMAMTAIVGAAGALAYLYVGGPRDDIATIGGAVEITARVGLPLIVADLLQCLTNAMLLSGVIHFHQRVPFVALVRRFLETSGLAYVGYGVIGFLFVVLWFPTGLGPFSAVLVMAPLLAARWAFIQYGDELRSHERTLDTRVTALGTKEPAAVERSRRAARLAEWLAADLGLGPHQIGTARQAGTLHEIGHLAVPVRTLRRPPQALSDQERRLLESHGPIGARMIEGIDFLDDARAGIRHQHDHFDGRGRGGGPRGDDSPVAARIVAVAARFTALTTDGGEVSRATAAEALRDLEAQVGRYDPAVVDALRGVLSKHGWPPPAEVEQ